MIIFIYNFLVFLHAIYFLGNTYAAYKFYMLSHPWGRYVAVTFAGNAIFGLTAMVTSGLGPRPAQFVLWAIIVTILGRVAKVVGIIMLTLFLFGWINGVKYSLRITEDKTE